MLVHGLGSSLYVAMSMKTVLKTAQGVMKSVPHPGLVWQHRYPVGFATAGVVGAYWINKRRRMWKKSYRELDGKVSEAVTEVQAMQAQLAAKAKDVAAEAKKTKSMEGAKAKVEAQLKAAEAKITHVQEELKQAKTLRAAEKKEWQNAATEVAAAAEKREKQLTEALRKAEAKLAATVAAPKEA